VGIAVGCEASGRFRLSGERGGEWTCLVGCGTGWGRPSGPAAACVRTRDAAPARLRRERRLCRDARRASPRLARQPFVSCASNSYPYEGWPLVASVLLDPADPGSRPAALPGMRPLEGHDDVYEAEGSDGHMLMRRVPGAWLIVARGRNNGQLLRVLDHLTATVRDRG
jgi:hypothetical protein